MPPTFSQRDRSDPNAVQGDRAISSDSQREIRVCQHKTCRKDGAAKVLQTFLAQRSPEVSVVPTGCMGNCGNGPMVSVWPDQVSYSQVRSRDVAAIVTHHSSSERERSPEHRIVPQNFPPPDRQCNNDKRESAVPTGVFWPYVALGLALLIALGSILGTALSLG